MPPTEVQLVLLSGVDGSPRAGIGPSLSGVLGGALGDGLGDGLVGAVTGVGVVGLSGLTTCTPVEEVDVVAFPVSSVSSDGVLDPGNSGRSWSAVVGDPGGERE